MRGNNTLHRRPYIPPTLHERQKAPYICRLAPDADGFTFEWFDNEKPQTHHTLFVGERGGAFREIPLEENVVRVGNLKTEREYCFYIQSADGRESNHRLVRTCAIPEGTTLINYLHPDDTQYDFSGRYLCSPSLARTKSGRLIAGMDVYGPQMAQNLTLLFYSDDEGEHWHYLCDLYPFYWGSLFVQEDKLYILGLNTEYGNLQIALSEDEGESWSAPTTLFYGANVLCPYGGMHRGPMHLTENNGRLFGACEYGSWASGSHIPAVFSIDKNADPMLPENWVLSEFLPFGGEWKKATGEKQGDTMEGNILRAPDGHLYNYLRWKCGEILRLQINEDDPEAPLIFSDIIKAPVSNSMFRIFSYRDKWLMVANDPVVPNRRNLLSLFESDNLLSFRKVRDLIDYSYMDAQKHGFQYPTFLLEENTLLLVIRSAFNQADTYHNSNCMLFMKTKLDICEK